MISKILVFGRMIKFSHTIFALPFALTSAVLASREHPLTIEKIFWIIMAMIGARTAAMGFNRIVDAPFDAQNPRTANREIPRGVIGKSTAALFVILSAALLIVASYFLNALCFYLSPLALAIVLFYSLTKRFTSWSHVFLGIALGVAPLGAWIALSGEWNWYAFMLGCAVLAWVAGFDIIYACQDYEFDKETGLFSIPKTFGISNALWISRLFHVAAFTLLILVGYFIALQWLYFLGVIIIGIMLLYEQLLVKPHDLSKVNVAFMNLNGVISVLYFIVTACDVYWV
ncbi:UbiA family prenyltransferase [bacterium]|nr:UbiA family prenyltransferase [bacterium]